MRSPLLNALFSSVESLPGVGPRTRQFYERIAGGLCVDLLYHLPISYLQRSVDPVLSEVSGGEIVCLEVVVLSYSGAMRKKQRGPIRIKCQSSSGQIALVYFNMSADYLKRILPIGQVRVVSGKVERYDGGVQIAHPDYVLPVAAKADVAKLEPQYSLTQGLSQKQLLKVMKALLHRLPMLPEWNDSAYMQKRQWPNWRAACYAVHGAQENRDIALQRLAYDELLASQLALKLIRYHTHTRQGQTVKATGQKQQQLRAMLPFALTQEQERVIVEIAGDQSSSARMMRLLQGDVGCGKTMVAFFAMCGAIEAGYQATIMAPTEILAEQHMKTLRAYGQRLHINVALLTGKTKAKERSEILAGLVSGEVHLLVGTHAVFQEEVVFHKLGLAVIDEQHRFGVKQRVQLAEKGRGVDVLLMSATPIPRTLTLAVYGDMECSQITQKPAGRKPIETRVMPVSKIDAVIEGVRREIDKGHQAYWICPLVEESDVLDLSAVEERYTVLSEVFGKRVMLIHGKMKRDEQEAVMRKFKETPGAVLVATTVIEVGVDCPDATVIVIEHAEHFGLSQLHQLRGRVGRGDKASSCVLLYQRLTQTATQRLKAMRQSNDGFYLAEEDLKLRGGGDILGVKQSGLPEFLVVSIEHHFDLLKDAANDAKYLVHQDPFLKSDRGEALKILLHLFRCDEHVRYLGI